MQEYRFIDQYFIKRIKGKIFVGVHLKLSAGLTILC